MDYVLLGCVGINAEPTLGIFLANKFAVILENDIYAVSSFHSNRGRPITRAIIENFRGDSVRGVWFDGAISTSQLIAVVGVLVGIALLATASRRPVPATGAP